MNRELVKTAENYMLTLDYWDDMICFAGHELPTGSLACMLLNMPEETVLALYELCVPLNDYIYRVAAGHVDIAGRDRARHSIYRIMELLDYTEPFCWLNAGPYRDELDRVLSPENLKRAQRELEKGAKRGAAGQRFLDYVGMFAILGNSVRGFREVIGQFADRLDDQKSRRPEAYAKAFAEFFPLQAEDKNSWMSMINVTEQYAVTGGDMPHIVKRKHYVSFVGLFRAELYEALILGHAPKKCKNCGRYFLLTDARQTKYCSGRSPDNPELTCRQEGARLGREAKERAEDHPVRQLYDTLLNTANKRIRNNNLSPELGAQVKKLAKRKKQRAIRDNDYANGAYKDEMKLDTLIGEVQAVGR